MSTAVSITLPPFQTVAELLQQLGDIPPERVRLHPVPGTATEKDVITSKARFNCLCELVDGVLVEKPMGFFEARLAFILGFFLEKFLETHDLGIAVGADAVLRVQPGQVRLPDLSFFSWDRFPNRIVPREAILQMTPDLAVEVLSPSNTKKEMLRKRREYFGGGCRLVWEVDPRKRALRVYTSATQSILLQEDDTLDGGEVIPGFRLPIRDWFKRAGREK
jgi:Uma2 family endonuclease